MTDSPVRHLHNLSAIVSTERPASLVGSLRHSLSSEPVAGTIPGLLARRARGRLDDLVAALILLARAVRFSWEWRSSVQAARRSSRDLDTVETAELGLSSSVGKDHYLRSGA